MKRKKILIIDDEPDVVTYLTAVLESHGYESIAAKDITTAMEKVIQVHPDLICLDIVMPKETGISFYKKFRQDKEFDKIPVIMISGVVESEKFDFRSFVNNKKIPEPECYLEKPVNVHEFIQKIEMLLTRQDANRK